MKLTAANVARVFRSCFFSDEGPGAIPHEARAATAVIARGIRVSIGFDPAKLAQARDSIHDLLDQTPEVFANGYTFIGFVADRDGNQWTDFHQTAEELLLLGLAIGRIEYCCSRDLWCTLPGGVPYFAVRPRPISDVMLEFSFKL